MAGDRVPFISQAGRVPLRAASPRTGDPCEPIKGYCVSGNEFEPPALAAASTILEQILDRFETMPPERLRANLELARDLALELEAQVEHDVLTGAYNRRGLQRLHVQVTGRRQRLGEPVSALFIDVDNLKELNRTYGHVATDGLLRSAAVRLRDLSRPYDMLVRWGGDEFVLLLPGVDLSSAVGIAERIRNQMASRPLEGSVGPVEMSVSIGVGALAEGEDVEDLIRRISALMYEAKSAGKNRVAVADWWDGAPGKAAAGGC